MKIWHSITLTKRFKYYLFSLAEEKINAVTFWQTQFSSSRGISQISLRKTFQTSLNQPFRKLPSMWEMRLLMLPRLESASLSNSPTVCKMCMHIIIFLPYEELSFFSDQNWRKIQCYSFYGISYGLVLNTCVYQLYLPLLMAKVKWRQGQSCNPRLVIFEKKSYY